MSGNPKKYIKYIHRKQSLESVNPFAGCGATWLSRGGVTAMLQPALRSALPPDALLAAARDSAPDLAARLTPTQIHEMVRKMIMLVMLFFLLFCTFTIGMEYSANLFLLQSIYRKTDNNIIL